MISSTQRLLAIALWLSSAASSLAGLIVDSFQTPLSIQNVGGSGGSAPATGVFGLNRIYSLQVFSGITQQLDISGGKLDLSVSPSVSLGDATLQLTYVDPTPSEDLNALGLNYLLIEDVVATGNWNLTVTLKNSLDQTFVSSLNPLTTNDDFLLNLSAFSPSTGTLGQLKEVSLFFNVSGVSPQIGFGTVSFTTAAEPSTLAIVGAGFLGASLVRRRWSGSRK